jgi:hypothetical protein
MASQTQFLFQVKSGTSVSSVVRCVPLAKNSFSLKNGRNTVIKYKRS